MTDFSDFYFMPTGITATMTGFYFSADLNACFLISKFITFVISLYGSWHNSTPKNKPSMGPSPPSMKHAQKTCTCRHAHGFLHMVCACVTSPITHANEKITLMKS